jgi:hypothetical protein
MKQTAVQWLVEKLMKGDFVNNPDELIEQAKAMEKEQIMDAWKHGNIPTFLGRVLTAEQYYKETYETI